MKRILITGKTSYIGVNLKVWLEQYPDKYQVESISVRDNSWKNMSFSGYDVVVHVAGLAHIREKKHNTPLYYSVNRDLAFEIAVKAKDAGVNHFIFFSSMSVFGVSNGVITKNTVPNPVNHYGKSKLEAENLINSLANESFRIAILRPPMVYGYGCKGNYPKLAKLANLTPVFPRIDNKRSVIYIDNLSDCICCIVDGSKTGFFHPQNSSYVSTGKIVEQIALVRGRKVIFTKLFNGLIRIGTLHIDFLNKVFGTLVYDWDISIACETLSFADSITRTENPKF